MFFMLSLNEKVFRITEALAGTAGTCFFIRIEEHRVSDMTGNQKDGGSEVMIRKIMESIASVKYGSVLIVIQDGKIVQIEKNEKLRLC